MFRILIVDDHEHQVESLVKSIPWDELEFDQVHQAYSGTEALDLLHACPIDIVITDIRMPGMSGLELLQRIRQKWKRIKCVLFSGYADFEYAQQAIQFHTDDYILKPADDAEIVACLRRLTESIRKEWEDVSSHQRTLYTLRENFPKLRDGLLNELLQGRSFAEQALSQQLSAFEIPFAAGDEVMLMLVRMDDSFYAYNDRDVHLREYAIGNMAEEIFRDEYVLWKCKDPHDYLIFLMKRKRSHQEDFSAEEGVVGSSHRLEREASELQNSVQTFLHGKISILLSTKGTFPGAVPQLYQSSLRVVRQRFGKQDEFLISADSFDDTPQVNSSAGLYDSPTLIQLLEAGRWEAIEDKLRTVFGEMVKLDRQTHQEHLLEVCLTVSGALIYISHKNGKLLESVIGEDWAFLFQPNPFRSVDQLQQWVWRVLRKMQADMQSEQNETAAYLVRRAQQYVEDHLSGDTSLQTVADHVRVHPVYLSRVYKSETGEGLSGYILRLKMEKAEKMLLDGSQKIHEIAERLGYANPPYFIKVFKKHSGLTPKEFREHMTR
ncbi:response regulator [Cohnella sp. REN36]|uniref:response regulator n=1 Tax=Cohnella sp. REN36 TaxID=2887347 RepID=UPI001D14DF25|nr:response regulator [Cohnella sp. REN36]MCC3375288.1 response regulator [Cohnella sp. REN36]